MRHVCPGGQLPPHTPAAPFGTSPQGTVVVVVELVVVVVCTVVDVVEDVVADDVVVVGAAGHIPVPVSQGWPEQHTLAAEHGSPVNVQQPHPSGPGTGWHLSNWTGHRPLQLEKLQILWSGKQEQLLPAGAFIWQVCPGGQLPPQTPAAPFGTSRQGIVVVVVEPVGVVVVVGPLVVAVVDALVAVVVETGVVVVVGQCGNPSACAPAWNAARSAGSPSARAASTFCESWLASSMHCSAGTSSSQSWEPTSVIAQS
jgi:hypothetical protein